MSDTNENSPYTIGKIYQLGDGNNYRVEESDTCEKCSFNTKSCENVACEFDGASVMFIEEVSPDLIEKWEALRMYAEGKKIEYTIFGKVWQILIDDNIVALMRSHAAYKFRVAKEEEVFDMHIKLNTDGVPYMVESELGNCIVTVVNDKITKVEML